ncbi:related to YFH7 - putative kinase [Moesziomyces antarcticus]|uniref:Related to YFH7 - putative kinase n=1 Tax=Pseudozyma antarctica TaxID=84753 RepID=A0A5C3FJC6_PSEA2|nr:related to YFH7 - putative kinase [Moesziomyces antarcticus]
MQDQVDRLVSNLLEQVKRRVLVGISGIPGSGKSLLAVNLVRALNSAWQSRLEVASGEDVAICVGMDGWHYPRSVLSTFPNAQEAFDRRGAEWTFDAKRFADFVVTVKSTASTPLYAPSFDHAKKDPLEDDVAVLPSHRVVVFEGLYCNCDVGEWKRAAEQFDVRLVFEISKQDAKTRLITRHVATGVAKDTEEAIWRADNNDLPNGDWLMSHLLAPYTVVTSIDDPSWR